MTPPIPSTYIMGNISGGQREYIPHLTRAAAACGIDAMFMEVHDDPPNALSDANTVLDVKYFEVVLAQAKAIHESKRIAGKMGR